MPRIADVEGNEQVAPLLYLYRRLGRDTGGAGSYRGGRGAEMAVTLGGIDSAEILVMTHGLEVPNSVGLFGGWPGTTVRQRFGSHVLDEGRYPRHQLAEDPEQLGGAWQELGPKPGLMPMTKEDVFAVLWQGGGGWGDPLDRDPEAVWSDLRNDVISNEVARSVYGVVVGEQGVDLEGTNARRHQIRQERIGKTPIDGENERDASTGTALGPLDTSPKRCDILAQRIREKGIKPEWEVMNPVHILQDMQRLATSGYDKPPYYVNLMMGMDRAFQGAVPYTPKMLELMINCLPPDSIFCVGAIGPSQLPATTQAVMLGGHVRVGLEDNNYYARGQLATNEQLMERMVRIIRELGCEPATPTEARQILGLKPVQTPSLASS